MASLDPLPVPGRALAFAPLAGDAGGEAGRAFPDPGDETGKTGMAVQRFDGGIVAGEFGLGQACVDFAVADVVEQYGRPALAAFEFRDEVVQALRDIRRYGALAEGADRI